MTAVAPPETQQAHPQAQQAQQAQQTTTDQTRRASAPTLRIPLDVQQAVAEIESTSTKDGKPGARLRFTSRVQARSTDVIDKVLGALGVSRADPRAALFENMSRGDEIRLWDLFKEPGYVDDAVRKQAAKWALDKNPATVSEFVAAFQFYDAEVARQQRSSLAQIKAERADEIARQEAARGTPLAISEIEAITRTLTARELGRPFDKLGPASDRAARTKAVGDMSQTASRADGSRTTKGAEVADSAWKTNTDAQAGEFAAGVVRVGDQTDGDLPTHVQAIADRLSFSNQADAAYHAHKHAKEMSPVPTPENEMTAYITAARQLIRSTPGVTRHNQNGSRSVVFQADGMRVIVSVGVDGNASIATFGAS